MSEIWDSPLYPVEERLQMAIGGIAFRDKVIKNLRERLDAAPQHSADIDAMRDAERYRWLKDNAATGSIGFGGWWIGAMDMSDELDAAIDAALQAKT